jgi:hypothetical protein
LLVRFQHGPSLARLNALIAHPGWRLRSPRQGSYLSRFLLMVLLLQDPKSDLALDRSL